MACMEIARDNLIRKLDAHIADKRVVDSMRRVPRESFVPPESRFEAYDDRPLSIGFGQTISQPFIVALMLQALELKGKEKVLELGTGSGYEAAVLSEMVSRVITVEIVPELEESAKRVLQELGYSNVEVHIAGKTLGWSAEAPYDAIMVSAGSPRIPQILVEQLAWGGRMVIPVGSYWEQELVKVTKCRKRNKIENLGGCYFVPLIGEGGWEK